MTDSASPGKSQLRLATRNGEALVAQAAREGKHVALAPDASLDDACIAILGGCRALFQRHAAELERSCDVEAIHQLRVALRRLRAFLGLLKTIAPGEERESLAAEAKEIAGAMGPARDLDVFCEALRRDLNPLLDHEPGLCALLDAAEAKRFEAQGAARAALTSDAARRFEADLDAFISRRPWRGEGSDEPGSARVFAVKALRRSRRRALRSFEGLAQASPEQLHRARIAVKKARYAAELFADLFATAQRKTYARGLAKIQDRLGEANDRTTAERLLDEIVDARPALAPARAALSRLRAAGPGLETTKPKRWTRKLRGLEPFWRAEEAEETQ